MIRTKEELLKEIKDWRPDDTSDEMISIVEDISDYYDANKDNDDWRKKYEENDAEWRSKYRDRFMNPEEVKTEEKEEIEKQTPRTFEDLFKEE